MCGVQCAKRSTTTMCDTQHVVSLYISFDFVTWCMLRDYYSIQSLVWTCRQFCFRLNELWPISIDLNHFSKAYVSLLQLMPLKQCHQHIHWQCHTLSHSIHHWKLCFIDCTYQNAWHLWPINNCRSVVFPNCSNQIAQLMINHIIISSE